MKPVSYAFITQDDPFYVRVFFETFLRECDDRSELKTVVIAPAMGKKSLVSLLRQMYDFYGSWDFLRVGTRYVLYRVASKLPPWLCRGRFYSVKQTCEHYGVPVLFAQNINAANFVAHLARLELDLIVSVAAPQIFRSELISVPRLGCINIHNSKLPKYRGMLPNFWQMLHGEKAVGTTVHRLNTGIDDGDILLQTETPIERGESLESLIIRTKRLGARLVIDALRQLRSGTVSPMPNRKEDATYFSFPTRRDVKEFRRRGLRLV